MALQCDWPCWEIMNCKDSDECLARFRQDTPCWEIAKEMCDYRHIMQICVDCIVYMLKGKNTVLSKNEIQSIMVQKANCVLTRDECQTTF